MPGSPFYNAHHSPVGAFASFTFGAKGARGGFGLELGRPANQELFIGFESADEPGTLEMLPFFESVIADTSDFDADFQHRVRENVWHFKPRDDVRRQLGPQTDRWTMGDLTLAVSTPAWSLSSPPEKDQILPVVYVELVLDNMLGDKERKWVFGFRSNHPTAGLRPYRDNELNGVVLGRELMISTDDTEAWSAVCFDVQDAIDPEHRENVNTMLGDFGVLCGRVGPQEARRVRIVVAFHREGPVTSGIETRYHYVRHFKSLESVTLGGFDTYETAVQSATDPPTGLSASQDWMRAMAIRSYYGSTQLLETAERELIWNVNEGEYRMMNTLDLTVDQTFFEIEKNPWTTKNVLDLYSERYAYWDDLQQGEERVSGGLTFAHDMGVTNQFSEAGRSSYERAGLTGCFSYMSYEELTNWVLAATMVGQGDLPWLAKHANTFRDALSSLIFRDAEDEGHRKGFMQRDGARCRGGAEITTYDSLDASLGQARANAYLASKAFAAFLACRTALSQIGLPELAAQAEIEADRSARAILAHIGTDGRIPALLGEPSASLIIPVIEALAYPLYLGQRSELETKYADLLTGLKTHFESVLQPGVCKFEDGGWKLSSTSNNSWLSKIYLCQWVARELWGVSDPEADAAHVEWLLRDGYWCWSDQIVAGRVQGSKYYPRGVTSELWLRRTSQSG